MATAKILRNYDNGDQDIALPPGFQFDSDFVIVKRDPETGDVILSAPPPNSAKNEFAEEKP